MNANELASLIKDTAEAHHQAYEETEGVDPEWPLWYAERLHESLNEALGATCTKSELIYLIVTADKDQSLRAPGARWPHYYAKFFLERFS